ncbi:hypothetical protein CgunFtcFv8_026492 [Champsocephalus gunnari]|uniref:Secreted protein n=1 Tax=Champsocephalus gunnari TaxID=52237 RepID=A0AAN8DVR2_CHAGU|nr:hypothetical protein CgunFtcFv8_026492 [Champsocephalus gunnari]
MIALTSVGFNCIWFLLRFSWVDHLSCVNSLSSMSRFSILASTPSSFRVDCASTSVGNTVTPVARKSFSCAAVTEP